MVSNILGCLLLIQLINFSPKMSFFSLRGVNYTLICGVVSVLNFEGTWTPLLNHIELPTSLPECDDGEAEKVHRCSFSCCRPFHWFSWYRFPYWPERKNKVNKKETVPPPNTHIRTRSTKRYKLYHVQLLDGLWLFHRDKHHLQRSKTVSLIKTCHYDLN